jgi:hypothetical protein
LLHLHRRRLLLSVGEADVSVLRVIGLVGTPVLQVRLQSVQEGVDVAQLHAGLERLGAAALDQEVAFVQGRSANSVLVMDEPGGALEDGYGAVSRVVTLLLGTVVVAQSVVISHAVLGDVVLAALALLIDVVFFSQTLVLLLLVKLQIARAPLLHGLLC